MSTNIRQLKDPVSGDVFYPQTDIAGLVSGGGPGIDAAPTAGSVKPVQSGGVADAIAEEGTMGKKMLNLFYNFDGHQKQGYNLQTDGSVESMTDTKYTCWFATMPVNKGAILNISGTSSRSLRFTIGITTTAITEENWNSVVYDIFFNRQLNGEFSCNVIVPYDGYIVYYRYVGTGDWPAFGGVKVFNSSNLKDNSLLDVSELNNATYANLSGAIAAIPTTLRKGGMGIRYRQIIPATYSVAVSESDTEPTGNSLDSISQIMNGTYDEPQLSDFSTLPAETGIANAVVYFFENEGNYTIWTITKVTVEGSEYVQYRLMQASWSTEVSSWQGTDSELLENSRNYTESNTVYRNVSELNSKIDNTNSIIYSSTNIPIVNEPIHDCWRIGGVCWTNTHISVAPRYIILNVKPGEIYRFKRIHRESPLVGGLYLLKSVPVFSQLVEGQLIDYTDYIENGRVNFSKDDTLEVTIPEDTKCIACLGYYSNNSTESRSYIESITKYIVSDIPTPGDNGFPISNGVYNDRANISILTGKNIPFATGSYNGLSLGYIKYAENTARIRIELPTHNLKSLQIASGYLITSVVLYQDIIPTSLFTDVTSYVVGNTYIDVENTIDSITTAFVPNRCIVILKAQNGGDLSDITSIDDIISLKAISGSEKTNVSVKSISLSGGTIGNSGLYPTVLNYYLNYAHTPKFIKIKGTQVIKTRGIGGYIYFYDKDQNVVGTQPQYSTADADYKIVPSNGAAMYFRIGVSQSLSSFIPEHIDIEGSWDGDDDDFQKLPVDEGYQAMTFVVDVNTCKQPSAVVSEITQQYVKSTDSGVIHLPSSYNHKGKPTPLIIYIHGEADRYKVGTNRFADNNPLAPEWDAAGYAQMDIDTVPDCYNYERSGSTGKTTGGTSDDAACIEAAYEWAISHFNIDRNGVYLIGRSRGGQAVMQMLGRYDANKLPVLAAISNAGANTLINYEIFRGSSANEWELFCESHGLPEPGTDGCPEYTSQSRNNIGALISNSDIAAYLRSNINIWWNKAITGLPMLEEYPDIPVINDNGDEPFNVRLFDLIVESYKTNTTDANHGAAFCAWMRNCVMRSPVPLRFDWCHGDQTQTDWSPTSNSYSAAELYAFLNDKISGKEIYRYWPTADDSGSVTNPHWHELMNFYDGDYILSNGVTIHNPSMARLEWLLWCQRHDSRYNGTVQPTANL